MNSLFRTLGFHRNSLVSKAKLIFCHTLIHSIVFGCHAVKCQNSSFNRVTTTRKLKFVVVDRLIVARDDNCDI